MEGDGAAVASVTAALFDDVGPAVTRPFSLAIYTDIWNDIFGQFEPGELVGTLTMADALPLPTGPDRGPDGKIVGVTFTATGIPITPHGNYWVVLPGYADASAPNGEVEWAYTTVPEPGVPETLALMVGVVGMLGITRRFRR